MNHLYEIEFLDGTKFLGGNLQETKWMQIPDRPIVKFTYNTPYGEILTIRNAKRYYHYVEVVQDIMNGNKGLSFEYTYLIFENTCGNFEITKFNLKTKKIESRDIIDKDCAIIKQLNPNGWKKGI